MNIILAAITAYLLGSIPFGLLLTRLAGIGDIRHIGSGNIGATNVLRTGSKALAAVTLVCDIGKSQVPALGYTVTYAVGNTLLTIWGMVLVLLMT